MLRWVDSDPRPSDANGVWEQVSDALVHPAAAVAAKLLRVTSKLPEIGALPLAPSGAADEPPTLVPHEDDLTIPRVAAARLGAGPTPTEAPTDVTTPRLARTPAAPAPSPPPSPPQALMAVDGSPGASDVLVMKARAREPQVISGLPDDVVADLADEHGYSGAFLRAVRERLGLSLRDVADHTRISERYLEALEAEARDTLPSATFVRGYVREVARMLHLDADAVVGGYMGRLSG